MHKKAKSEPLSTEELERKYPSAAIMHKHFSVPTKPSTEVLADFTAAPKNCEDAVTAAGSPHSSLSSESKLEGFLRESKSEELITIEQPGKKISINSRLANIEASTTKL